MRIRNAISASLTELILITVTFAAVFAFSNFIINNIYGLSSSMHRLQIYPDSKLIIDTTHNETYAIIRIYTDIKPNIVISKLIINNYKNINISIIDIINGNPKIDNRKLVLPAGSDTIVRFDMPPEIINSIKPNYWGVIEGHIITEQGFIYKVNLKIIFIKTRP